MAGLDGIRERLFTFVRRGGPTRTSNATSALLMDAAARCRKPAPRLENRVFQMVRAAAPMLAAWLARPAPLGLPSPIHNQSRSYPLCQGGYGPHVRIRSPTAPGFAALSQKRKHPPPSRSQT